MKCCSAFICIVIIKVVSGNGKFSLSFETYDNDGGLDANGEYCDGTGSFYVDQCDYVFIICIDDLNGSDDLTTCSYGNVTSDKIVDMDNIEDFGEEIGGLQNPIVVSFTDYKGGFKLKVSVWDEDTGLIFVSPPEFVDFLKREIREGTLPVDYGLTFGTRTSLGVGITIKCDTEYYGRDCSIFCTNGEHYDCGPEGNKMCHQDYYGPNCDVFCQGGEHSFCNENGQIECNENYYGAPSCEMFCKANANSICSNEGHLVCLDDYYGNTCETFCKDGANYACNSEGEKVCETGWTGTDCDIAITTTTTTTGAPNPVKKSGKLRLNFKSFENPGGLGDNGHCCDGRGNLCPDACDHSFILCVDKLDGDEDLNSCEYGRVVTGLVARDKDSVTFEDMIGTISNPIVFNFSEYKGGFKLKLDVWDDDSDQLFGADDHVEYTTFNYMPGDLTEVISLGVRTQLIIGVEITIDQ